MEPPKLNCTICCCIPFDRTQELDLRVLAKGIPITKTELRASFLSSPIDLPGKTATAFTKMVMGLSELQQKSLNEFLLRVWS